MGRRSIFVLLCVLCARLSATFQLSAAMLHPCKVALVTGANKGIGKEVARKLHAAGFTTVLGCRDVTLGAAAANEIIGSTPSEVGSVVVACPLDLTESTFGRLDVLVNNAAVCFNDPTLYGRVPHTPFEKQARVTVETNFFGTLGLTRAALPLLKKAESGRIVNVASNAGRLAILKSEALRAAFSNPAVQISELEEFELAFIADVEAGTHARKGWPNTCYGVSKVGVIALTKALARDEPGLMVNAVDPGYCATDQNANQGYISAEEGARTPALLAMLPNDKPVSGKYFYEGREIAW